MLLIVDPVRILFTGSFFVNDTSVPIHESSITGFVRTYIYVFGGVTYAEVPETESAKLENIPNC
jgi:hypothetical protein